MYSKNCPTHKMLLNLKAFLRLFYELTRHTRALRIFVLASKLGRHLCCHIVRTSHHRIPRTQRLQSLQGTSHVDLRLSHQPHQNFRKIRFFADCSINQALPTSASLHFYILSPWASKKQPVVLVYSELVISFLFSPVAHLITPIKTTVWPIMNARRAGKNIEKSGKVNDEGKHKLWLE